MSALARYGTLQVSFELPRSESHLRTPFGADLALSESGGIGPVSHTNTLYSGLDHYIWGVNLGFMRRYVNTDGPVNVAEEERCDACLGVLEKGGLPCSICGVFVHETCYSRSDESNDERHFTCDVCRTKGVKVPRCHLCNLSGGVMRFAHLDNVWVHCSCVFMAPQDAGVTFGKPLYMGDPSGVRSAVSDASEKSCDACASPEGLLVSCSFPKCLRHLHSRCAAFQKNYGGTSFSDIVYYYAHERKQYFNFIGTFCKDHATSDHIVLAIQMQLRRRYVIRRKGSSSYRKYQSEVADIVRMTTAVTSSAIKEDETEDGENRPTKVVVPQSVMNIYPYIKERTLPVDDSSGTGKGTTLKQWIDYFKTDQPIQQHYVPAELICNPDDDEIHVDVPAQVHASADELPVVDVQSATGEVPLDGSSSQFRSQRMLWQKFDIFRPIPYGPYADEVLKNLDINSQKKSISEYANLESNILSCSDFLEPREMSEIYLQQIIMGCTGILSLLESLKMDVDRGIQSIPKSGVIPPLSDRKELRFHVLVDTGRTSGILIYKVEKWFLDALDGDSSDRKNMESSSEASLLLDEEVRHFLSQVQSDLVRSSYASGMFMSSNGGVKELDIVSGIGEYSLKDDLRYLHTVLNSSNNDNDAIRGRRKAIKKNKNNISLRNMELEDFIVLTSLECELLRRGTLEMSHVNDSNLKLGILKNTVDVSHNVSCLHLIDWASIMRQLQSTSRDVGIGKSSNSRGTKQAAVTSRASTPGIHQRATSTVGSATSVPHVPMIYLGKETWPVVDDVNFVRYQKELTESELTAVKAQLRKIRQNIREQVLDINSRQPRVNERLGLIRMMLDKYEAMDRWSTLVIHFCRGLNDSVDLQCKTPSVATSVPPALPMAMTLKNSEVRIAAKKAESLIEGAYCSVCFINRGNNLNPVYTCSRCFMSCHRNCYGVGRAGKEQDQSDYICRRCEYERRSMGSQWQTAFRSCSILCCLCGRGGGALKRCDGDEWAHVFCLLSLLPETSCANYVTLEPWTLVGLANWRRENTCTVCGIHWGFVLRCSDCDVTAHPLCAWLHGFKFSPSYSMSYMSKLSRGETLMWELHVTMQCNEHDNDRQWNQYVKMRNKRFLNRDTAYSLFEGRDKRRKLRSLLPDSLTSQDSLDTAALVAEINETQQVVEEKRCGVCFGTGSLIDCGHCNASVHYWCYVEQESATSSSTSEKIMERNDIPSALTCDVCRNNDEGAICEICKVGSGVLKHIPGTGKQDNEPRRYMHIICGICFPEVLIMLYRGKEADVLVNEGEAVQCAVCHSSEGCMVRCFKDDCNASFHAFCGLANRFTVETHCLDLTTGQHYVVFCQQHSLLCKSVGNNVKILLRFRRYLKVLKDLMGDLAAQDTVMRAWYRKRQELLNAEYPLTSLLQKPH
ncbi:hypothetical protein X943_003397 [Babesia divergens]|uniref:Uncharacterized protein n=1 Tax=Babesia divergens TaxID=32595 RepID=A0AAD9G7Q4_BABDI|nr:hypothetical protein X943_003397 [Babesia divergens]